MNYSKVISEVPQNKPIPGMEMVKNSAGGFVFEASDQMRLERFLMLGTEKNTFYVDALSLTLENAKNIISMIKKDSVLVLNTLLKFVEENKIVKYDTAIFVLGLLTTYATPEVKQEVYKSIPKVLKTSTHLFTFLENLKSLRGWSRGLRNAVARFYTSKTPDQIAYQMAKYRQRNGWTHKDVIRLSHPVTTSNEMNFLFRYAIGKALVEATGNEFLMAVEMALEAKEPSKLAYLIRENNLTWEMVPTEMLNNKLVQAALLPKMPLQALLRNLNRFTMSGLFEGRTSEYTQLAVKKLTSDEEIKKARIHPIQVMNTLKIYSRGYGDKSGKTWDPNSAIVDALEELFEKSFSTVTPSNKKILVGVDVSGSMHAEIAGLSLSAREASVIMAMTILRSEPNAEVLLFNTNGYLPHFGKRSSYKEILKEVAQLGGGTDCSIPYLYALKKNKQFDAVVILTDNETWAGKSHPVTEYNKLGNVKNILVSTTATKSTLFSDKIPNTLNIAGFDGGTPQVISQFINGSN